MVKKWWHMREYGVCDACGKNANGNGELHQICQFLFSHGLPLLVSLRASRRQLRTRTLFRRVLCTHLLAKKKIVPTAGK
jgi:hypothetical protein|tara:strand:+ start:1283 stop:1519 length:237 start_codon:yes stop_codon:yes gene_type:complete